MLLEYPREIQRLGVSANIRDLGDVLLGVLGRTQKLLGHLHTQSRKVGVGGHSHLAFEQLAQVVIAEWDSAQEFIELVVAVGEIPHNVGLDRSYYVAQRLLVAERGDIIHYEISERRDYKLFVLHAAVKEEKRVIEGGEDMALVVVADDDGRGYPDNGVRDVDMNIREALVGIVYMLDIRRNDYNVTRQISQLSVRKLKFPVSPGAVYQLPILVRVFVRGECDQVFADICDFIHKIPP